MSVNGRGLVLLQCVAATLAATTAPAIWAADAPADEGVSGEVTEVVVTGTRTSNLLAVDSPSPIQILSPEALKAAEGNPDLMSTLAQIVPSLTMEAFGADMAGQTLLARLRGLSPNHVLVLVNGKRRHTTANLAVDGGSPYQGGAGVDLNFIPIDAIDHIEVLTDGAAAQYGTDAIAGVINIILKKDSSGGDVQATYGKYYNGGGLTNDVDGHAGFEPYTGGFFNLTGSVHNHGHSDVGADDPRAIGPAAITGSFPNSNILGLADYPHVNHIFGDAETHTKLAMFNTGLPLGSGADLYAFGSYGSKDAQSFENYRNPSRISCTTSATIPNCAGVTGQAQTVLNGDGTSTTYPYPFGFNPLEATKEDDYQVTAGVRGMTASTSWDLSTSYGADKLDLYTLNSIGNTYPGDGLVTPTNFYDGTLKATQWTTNLDLSRDFEVGLAAPLNVAAGVEYRRETYSIDAGIPDSYLAGGAQSYAGFAPVSAGTHDRKNQAVYLDLAGKLLDKLRFDAAARYEHYSDFGAVTAGKLSLKYDLTPELGIRATGSNGFRAPTLAEAYYTSTNVAPSSAQVQVQPDSAAAHLLGLGNLQAEKSVNLSVGLVWHPLPQVMTTLDVYQISITNRITGTGSLYGLINNAPQQYVDLVNTVIRASGQSIDTAGAIQTTSVQLFANGIDTRTRGADLTLKIPQELRFGHIDYTLAATYSKTELTNAPPVLPAAPDAPLYDPIAISEITTASPLYVINAGFTWTYEKLSINVLEKLYGPSKAYENADADLSTDVIDSIGLTPITNIDVSYQFNKNVKANLGALNVFDRYPPRINALAYNTMVNLGDYSSVEQYPGFSPFGIDGGFYYARLSLSF